MAYTISPGSVTLPDTVVADISGAYLAGAKARTDITKAEEDMRIAQIQREQDQQRIGLLGRQVGVQERGAALDERRFKASQAEAARQKAAAEADAQAGSTALERLNRGLTAPVPTAPVAAPVTAPSAGVTLNKLYY